MVGAAELVGERLRPAVGNRGNIPPGYPHDSVALGEQGEVVLRMTIGRDGLVRLVEVLQSSGYPRLDQAAQAHAEMERNQHIGKIILTVE